MLKVTVTELQQRHDERLRGWLLDTLVFAYHAQFDSNLTLRGVATTSDWDLLAERLVAEGAPDAVPGVDYVAPFADSLRYWDGATWVQGGPVANQRWAAAVDSLERAVPRPESRRSKRSRSRRNFLRAPSGGITGEVHAPQVLWPRTRAV